MNAVYKFTSIDVVKDKNFIFMNWLKDRAKEIMHEFEEKHPDYKLAEKERNELMDELISKRGMTLHFYFAGQITEKMVTSLRGIAEPKKITNDMKCSMCKILLTSEHAGKVENGKCEDCNNALKALKATAESVK